MTRRGRYHASAPTQTLAYAMVCFALIAFVGAAVVRHGLPINTYKAFYCGGQAVLHRANPYLMEPLRSCEHRVFTATDFPAYAVEPAPLPGYVLAGFAVLANLPVHASHAAFLGLLLAALFATGWALSKITGYTPAIVTLCCASLWLISTAYGEIPPICVAAIALCGWALERRMPVSAGIFACVAMIQPHIALPLCVALLVFVPSTRATILIGWSLLFLAGLVAGGLHTTLAYFTTYLPLQAASELSASDQYSLTYALHAVGAPARVALAAGSLSYGLMAALGIFAGRRLSKELNTPAFLAFTPAAFVLLGGTFVHDTQMFAALPFSLTLFSRARSHRVELGAAMALLAISWTTTGSVAAALIGAAAAFSVGSILFGARIRGLALSALLAFVLTASAMALNRLPAADFTMSTPAGATAIGPDAPSSDGWNALIRSVPFRSRPSLRSEARKIPTWLALALLVTCGLTVLRKTDSPKEEEAAEDTRYATQSAT